ncbi:MAG: hypothetical protein R2718_03100 [Solirubrobacterales bacterium]|nr:hypothetical protein [Solirubrobacterales bacterium]
MGSTAKRTMVACLLAYGVCAVPAGAAQPVSLKAESPQEQGKKVFVHVTTASVAPLDRLRLTGRIRVSGVNTYFDPIRMGPRRAGMSHTFTLSQSHPGQRRIVRKAMKRGMELTAKIRAKFHLLGGVKIVRKVQVQLVYRDGPGPARNS